MYVIVDWHILDDNNPTTYEKEAIEFFDEISKEYKNSPNVLYEICNEPNGDEVDWDNTIKPYAERVIKVIRDNSPKSVVIVGTANYSKDTESVINNPLKEKNILYAVHVYMGDDLSTTSDYITLAIDKKLPIIITECAATDGSGDGKLYLNSFKNVIDHFEKNNISWIVWQLSDKEESSSTLIPKYKQQNKWLAEFKYTKEELRKKKYDINDYLTKEGKLVKELLLKYTEEGR